MVRSSNIAAWKRARRGMTLVELMVVMAIAAGMMGLGVYGLSSINDSDLRDDAMRVAAAIKYTYANAAVNNAEYRLVFDLDTGEYYSEVARGPVIEQSSSVADTDDFLTEEAQRLAEKVEDERSMFDKEEENSFGVNRRITYERLEDGILKSTKLSTGTKFTRFISPANEEEYTAGKAAVMFYPNGFQDQVMIVIKGEDGGAYTLVTEPLTGRVLTYGEEIEVPEDFGVAEEDD